MTKGWKASGKPDGVSMEDAQLTQNSTPVESRATCPQRDRSPRRRPQGFGSRPSRTWISARAMSIVHVVHNTGKVAQPESIVRLLKPVFYPGHSGDEERDAVRLNSSTVGRPP